MDDLILPRCMILEKTLDAFNFDPPYYVYEPWDDGLFRCQIKFSLSVTVEEQMPNITHEVWSGWFPSIQEARENAAHRALNHLETIAVFHINDYSMSVIQNLRPQNHKLSKQCYDIAKAIERLIFAWTAMSSDINKASLLCSDCVAQNDMEEKNVENKHLLNSVLYQINKLSRKLTDLYERNRKNIRRYYQPITDLLKKHLTFHTTTDIIDPGTQHSNYIYTRILCTSISVPLNKHKT